MCKYPPEVKTRTQSDTMKTVNPLKQLFFGDVSLPDVPLHLEAYQECEGLGM